MYLKEEYHLGKKEKPGKVAKAIEDLIKKIRNGKDLMITLMIEEDERTYFYSDVGGTSSEPSPW